jgi:hypothetical protein
MLTAVRTLAVAAIVTAALALAHLATLGLIAANSALEALVR